MNIFIKIILILIGIFLLFNIGLFIFLYHYAESNSKKSLKDKIIKTFYAMGMSYSFFYFIIYQLIYGKKTTYQPVARSEYK